MSQVRSNKSILRIANCISIFGLIPLGFFWGCNGISEIELLVDQHEKDRVAKAQTKTLKRARDMADARASNHIVTNRLAVYIPGYIYSEKTRIYPTQLDYKSEGIKRRIAKSHQKEQIVTDDSDPHICVGVITSKIFRNNDPKDISNFNLAFMFKGSNNKVEADYARNACENYNKGRNN
ncbi:MAG: hypothetical protein F6K26_03410 [Moorea sp. SIO2I5]|nr:hypothetical protein [Moorena sp. SIO2I5]